MDKNEKKILNKYYSIAGTRRMYVFALMSSILVLFTLIFAFTTLPSGLNLELATMLFGLAMISAYTVHLNILEPFKLRKHAVDIAENYFTPLHEDSRVRDISMKEMSFLEQKFRFKELRRKKQNFSVLDQVESVLILQFIAEMDMVS
ncbi:hypothetical protein [Vibrio owensii]|uniref:hypothetical protein n=1 Tax=Vibrio harveyi group TaxID=717610 RepID=UPI003CC63919